MTILTKLPECRERCQAVLAQFGLQSCTLMRLAAVCSERQYLLLDLYPTDKECALFADLRIVSLSADLLVLALDAAIRAQLWPAREDA
jgi:hypothetical protein